MSPTTHVHSKIDNRSDPYSKLLDISLQTNVTLFQKQTNLWTCYSSCKPVLILILRCDLYTGKYGTEEQQDAFWMKLGTEKRRAASAKRSLIPSAFNLLAPILPVSNPFSVGLLSMVIRSWTQCVLDTPPCT